jgi:hypothetical protein
MRSETDRQKYRQTEIKRGRNILLSENEARKWEQKNRNSSLVKKVENEKKRKESESIVRRKREDFVLSEKISFQFGCSIKRR